MVLEQFHTPGILGNALSWGDDPILYMVEKVADV
jgi:hypothetical protein